MAPAKHARLVRIRSNLNDYVSRPDNGSSVDCVKNVPTWPEGFRDLWFMREGESIKRPTVHVKTFRFQSWNGLHLALDETGNVVTAEARISPLTDWEVTQGNDKRSEFRLHHTKGSDYLHRPSDIPPKINMVIGYEVDHAEGNDWMIEDMGPPPIIKTRPATVPIVIDQLVRFTSNRGDCLIPHHDGEQITERNHYVSYPDDVKGLWKVCQAEGGKLAFQAINGGYLAGPPVTPSAGVPDGVVVLTPDIGAAAMWDPSQKSGGKWELRNIERPNQYLSRLEKNDYTTIHDNELNPGNFWDIELYTPKAGSSVGPDENGKYGDWNEIMKARPDLWT